jgi:hypothetical protein
MLEVTLLVMKETLTIRNQVLKVAELRPINRWIVDFGDDAVPKRKPDSAGSCVRSSHSVFASMGPSRTNPRLSKRSIFIVYLRHPASCAPALPVRVS